MLFRPRHDGQLPLDAVVLGCAPSAGLYRRSIPPEAVRELLHTAARLGVTRLDTAPLYGCGRSEIDIRRAVEAGDDLPAGASVTNGRRSSFSIATKVGRYCEEERGDVVSALEAAPESAWRVEHDRKYYARDRDTGHLVCVADYTAAGIRKAFEQSKRRLGPRAAAAIHALRLHDVEGDERRFDMLIAGGGVEALVALKREGAVRHVGLGMNDPASILRLLTRFPKTFDSVLMAGAFNLIDQSGLAVLHECQRLAVEVHVAGVFGAGLLWGGTSYRYERAGSEQTARRDALQRLCAAHGVSLPWLAMHFATRPRCVTQLVIGCATADELRQCVDVLAERPDPAAVAAVYTSAVQQGLLPSAVVAPASYDLLAGRAKL